MNIYPEFNQRIKSTIWKYYLFSFLRGSFFISAVLIPFYTEWAHINFTQVQILQAWFMFWSFILEIPTGAVADLVGRKHSLVLGGIIGVFSVLIYGSVPNFAIFLLGEFLFAASLAFTTGANTALLYDALKEAGREKESATIFGKAHTFQLLGIFVSGPIGALIASRFGLNAPMLFSAIPFFLTALVAFSMKEPKFKENISEAKRYLVIVKDGLNYFRGHKVLRSLALDAVIIASASYFVIWLYQPLLMKINIPIFYFGFFHAFLVGVEMVIAASYGKLEKLFGGAKNYFRFSALVTAFSFLLVALIPNIITIILFLIFAGGFGLTRMELLFAFMNNHIPSDKRATVLSSISMLRQFALVPLNPVIGMLADRSIMLALLLISLLPLTIFLFSPIKKEALKVTYD